ncbi:MAG: sulfatase-like hydrolase/transferase [bacterium]|nr:sulfatase-like hydrolase/transferase [bacterium]
MDSPRSAPALALALLVLSYAPAAETAPDPPNILWVVWDTVRADRLSLMGHTRATTPRLDAWAKGARVFENCLSTASSTLPSHASMFTGLLPSEHGANNHHRFLLDRFQTVAELLADRGYRTYLFAANPHVTRDTNLTQGFEAEEHPWSPGYEERALDILRRKVSPRDRSSELPRRLGSGDLGPWQVKATGALARQGLEAWPDGRLCRSGEIDSARRRFAGRRLARRRQKPGSRGFEAGPHPNEHDFQAVAALAHGPAPRLTHSDLAQRADQLDPGLHRVLAEDGGAFHRRLPATPGDPAWNRRSLDLRGVGRVVDLAGQAIVELPGGIGPALPLGVGPEPQTVAGVPTDEHCQGGGAGQHPGSCGTARRPCQRELHPGGGTRQQRPSGCRKHEVPRQQASAGGVQDETRADPDHPQPRQAPHSPRNPGVRRPGGHDSEHETGQQQGEQDRRGRHHRGGPLRCLRRHQQVEGARRDPFRVLPRFDVPGSTQPAERGHAGQQHHSASGQMRQRVAERSTQTLDDGSRVSEQPRQAEAQHRRQESGLFRGDRQEREGADRQPPPASPREPRRCLAAESQGEHGAAQELRTPGRDRQHLRQARVQDEHRQRDPRHDDCLDPGDLPGEEPQRPGAATEDQRAGQLIAPGVEAPERVVGGEDQVEQRPVELARIAPVHQPLAESPQQVAPGPDPAGEDDRVGIQAE